MNFVERNNGKELLNRSIYCVSNSKSKISYLGGAKTKNLDTRVKQELGKNVGFYSQSRACKDIQPDIVNWTFNIPFLCTLETQEIFETHLKDCWEKDGKQNLVVSGLEAKTYNKEMKDKILHLNETLLKEEVIKNSIIE